jgi:predicted nuclease of predicted toxin-antitoxin system
MKILVDENIPLLTVDALRSLGHDVTDVRGTGAQGSTDADLWIAAQQDQRLLITTDKGFTDRRDEEHWGVLVVRLRQPNRQKIHDRVMRALTDVHEADWQGLILIMRDTVKSTLRRPDKEADAE